MKKRCITLFTLLYLSSCLGSSTVQHDCKMRRAMTAANGERCICSSATAAAEKNLQTAAWQRESCCDDSLALSLAVQSQSHPPTIRGVCCTDEAAFNLIDTTTLSKLADFSFDVAHCHGLSFYSDAQQNDGLQKSPLCTLHPAEHLNLPLII